MNLELQAALHGIALTLRERIAPAIDDGFASETARLAGLFLILNANWIDDAVAVRVAENSAIRSLFAQAEVADRDRTLGAELALAAVSTDPGLRISELDRENNRLRALLVSLHALADASSDARDKALSHRIWRMLDQFEAARAPRA